MSETALWAKEIARVGELEAELAAIKGNMMKAPHAKECAIAEWELRAWAYGRGHGPKPPDKPACNCWKAGPLTPAEEGRP